MTVSAGFVTVSAVNMTYGVIIVAEVVTNPAFAVINPAEIAETTMTGVAKLKMTADTDTADKVSEPWR